MDNRSIGFNSRVPSFGPVVDMLSHPWNILKAEHVLEPL